MCWATYCIEKLKMGKEDPIRKSANFNNDSDFRVIVDMDEVICKWVDRVLEWYNQDHGTSFTRDDIKHWNVTSDLPEDGHYFIRACMRYPEFYRDLDPIEGAIDGIQELLNDGFDVVIATATPRSAGIAYHGKLEWLRRRMPFFDLKSLVSISRKDLLIGDVLLDDGPHNIKPWIASGRYGVIFDHPWNRGHDCDARVKHWNEFVDLCRKLRNAKKKIQKGIAK